LIGTNNGSNAAKKLSCDTKYVRIHATEGSEIRPRISKLSLARKYSLKQLIGIDRKRTKYNLDLQYSRTYAKGRTESF